MADDRTPKLAYLVGTYPAVSLTFIQREVEALRGLGAEVLTCSVRQTGPEHKQGEAEKREAEQTFYLLKAARNPGTLVAAQIPLFTDPGLYLSTFWLAMRTGAPGLMARLYQLIYFVEATILARKLKQQDVDHLHNHFVSASASVAMLAARLARIPYSFTLHGPTDLIEPHRWRLDEKIARSEFVSCISHFARSQAMLQAAPEHWHKLKIIHCGVMPERYRKGGGADDSLRLVFVGRLAPVKGLRLLFEALPQVLDRHPNVQLTIVGDGPDRAVLEQLARPFGSAARFEGYKSQAEVAEILAASDAMVLPSFAEGVPVVLMEAMASSLPVLATRVAGVAELVEDGVNGYLVAPGDAEALADRIGNLASDPARRQAMGEAGRRTVEGGFVIEDEARRLLWLFRNGPEGPVRPNLP